MAGNNLKPANSNGGANNSRPSINNGAGSKPFAPPASQKQTLKARVPSPIEDVIGDERGGGAAAQDDDDYEDEYEQDAYEEDFE